MIKISKQHEKNEMRKIQMTEKQEFWDIYNEKKSAPAEPMKRNDWCLKDGEYHLTVLGVIKRTDGRFLITKRVMTKAWAPGCWEVSGGAAMAGEDSKTAVLREIREETGLDVSAWDGGYLFTYVEIIREKGITILWMCIVFLLILTSQISNSRRRNRWISVCFR